MKLPGYNSPQRMTFFNRLLVTILAVSLLPLAYAADTSSAQENAGHESVRSRWDSSASDLARQIAALTGPGTITLAVTNRSSIAADDVPIIRRALQRELRSAGVVVREKNAESDVRVTLSQNLQGWLWVAEVQEGAETKVAMLAVAGSQVAAQATTAPAMTLRASLLHAQADPILDIAMLGVGADQHMIVLTPEQIRSYAQVGGEWQLTQSYDIAHAQPLPRDVRGRIVPAADHGFDAYLSGAHCAASKSADNWALTISCSGSDDPWPLGSQKGFYNPARNFFTGVVVPGFGPKLPPFYSAAEVSRTGSTAFLFADVSGAVHILESGSHKLLIGVRDWGSDIAAVRSECGSGTQVLATAAGWPAADSLRAYEIAGREAAPASAPLNFNGTITTLWPAADGTSAIAIVSQPQGAGYEAYRISVVCSR